jgi:hypothetical protein
VKEALLGFGMMSLVRDFATRVKAGEIAFDPQTTLFFLGRRTQRPPTRDGDHTRQSPAGAPDPPRTRRRHFTIALLPTKIRQFAAVGVRLNPAYEQLVREEAGAVGLDLWLNRWAVPSTRYWSIR